MKKFLLGLVLLASPVWAAGTLEVGVSSASLPSVVPKSAVRVQFLTVTLAAADDDVLVDSLVLRQGGLDAPDDIGRMWAETDRYQRTFRSHVQTDGTVTLRWRDPIKILAGESRRVRVLGNVHFQKIGHTLRFDLLGVGTNADAITPAAPTVVR